MRSCKASPVILTVLAMRVFLWAFWSPQTNHGVARAAVINHDQPVTVNGKIVPLGRELAGKLTHSEAPGLLSGDSQRAGSQPPEPLGDLVRVGRWCNTQLLGDAVA